MNVGKDTTLSNSNVTEKLVQFLIVADGELEMARDDASLLVVTSGVTSQLENFSSQVLKNGSEVNGRAWKTTVSTMDASKFIIWKNSPAPTR